MSDYDRNLRNPELARVKRAGWTSGTWIGGAVIAVLLIIGIGYVFNNRSVGPNMVEHRAAATDTAPVSPAASPSTAPAAPTAPAATPKP